MQKKSRDVRRNDRKKIMQAARLSDDYKNKGRNYIRTRRLDRDYRNMEKLKNLLHKRKSKKKKSQSNAIRGVELKRKSESKRSLNTSWKKRARMNETFREKERHNDRRRRQDKKKNSSFRVLQQRMQRTQAMRKKRLSCSYRLSEQEQKRQSRAALKIPTFVQNRTIFLEKIKLGPTQHCSSCGGLWFPTSLKELKKEMVTEKVSEEFADLVFLSPSNGRHLFCFSCASAIGNKKVPRLCLSNGLQFPEIPEVLQGLTSLEERMCSLRLPFLRLLSLGVDRQCGLKGNVVHIPNDLEDTVGILPRTLNDSALVPVQLLRRKDHEHSYLFQEIRPAKVIEAVKYLLTTPLYQDANIKLDDKWISTIEEEMIALSTSASVQVESEDQDLNPGGHETMMVEQEPWHVITIAPGHGKRPLPITKDLDGEALSYPTIYGGFARKFKISLSYFEVAKSYARNKDRRCAKPHKILHAFKIYQNMQVKQAISIQMRKSKHKYSAKEVLQEGAMEKIVNSDLGYQVLQNVRTSPSFWEKKQKHLFAMIRQLGIPTLFVTLSAAESKWPELIIMLALILDKKTITVEDVENMTYEEKADLIRRDPVTCARYFDYRLRQCFTHLLNSQNGVFSPYKLVDYYWRIEFQHRGSPHVHMLLWLDGSPRYSEESMSDCVEFIDSLISCKYGETNIIHQQHRHTKSCHKYDISEEKTCRFHFPIPPMEETKILLPYPSNFPKNLRTKHRQKLDEIREKLKEMAKEKQQSITSLDDLLVSLQLTHEQYIAAIRSSLKRPTVFLKRGIDSSETNAYIKNLAELWQANMDAQFILDPYGCAKYVCSYISKSSAGVSKLLKVASEEAAACKLQGIEKFRKIGNTFLNFTEISSQEATYGVLALPLTKSSRDCVFIPTGPPNERVQLLKSRKELEELNEDSEDIYTTGLLEQYSLRPIVLEQMCLAEFASMYQFSKSKRAKKVEEFNEEGEIPAELCDSYLARQTNRGYVRRRKKGKVIRFVRYGEKMDPENYYREQVMLFWPWRNEERDILSSNCREIYIGHHQLFQERFMEYNRINIDEVVDKLAQSSNDTNEDYELDAEYEAMYDEDVEPDFGLELGKEKISIPERLPSVQHMPEDEFQELISTLNFRQRQYIDHLLKNLEMKAKFQEFVYGGAGVGKSTLIKAIVQCTLRYCVCLGDDPSTVKVLLASPTGKAAFNIGGGTLHHTFFLPISRKTLNALPDDIRNTLACHLRNLKLIIVDEVSMMASHQMQQVNRRMQQVFLSKEPFGGIPVIFVGDLRQLNPVRAQYIFSPVYDDLTQLVGNTLWEWFRSFELTEIMRQKDDADFALALNHLSKGEMTAADIALFESRLYPQCGAIPDDAIHIFGNNDDVDRKNASILKQKQEVCISNCSDAIEGKAKPETKHALLESVKRLDANDTMNMHEAITLAVGAKYMMTINVDVSDGLTNGSTCILRQIDYFEDGRGKRPNMLWIEFFGKNVGAKRLKLCALRGIACKSNWVPIWKETKPIKKWPGRGISCLRTQFPVFPAEAITSWKAQGDTYDNVVVYTKGLQRKALYVSLSRARKSSGLYIIGTFHPPLCPPTDRVETEMKKIEKRKLDQEMEDISSEKILKILYNSRLGILHDSINANKSNTQVEKRTPPIGSHTSNAALSPGSVDSTTEEVRDNGSPLQNEDYVIDFLGRYKLSTNDLNSLDGCEWLNDAIIDGFVDCVRHTYNASLYNFGAHFIDSRREYPDRVYLHDWTQELSCNFMTFTYCKNHHWTLLVADRTSRTVYGYDPFNHFADFSHANIVVQFLEEMDSVYFDLTCSWKFSKVSLSDTCVQRNGYDCGVYVCLIVEAVVRGETFDVPRRVVHERREYIRASLWAGRIVS